MLDNNYILKRPWQSRSGDQEELYLGYNENNKLDCIPDLPKAKKMTQKECEEFKSILANSKMWIIDVVSEEESEDIHNDNNEENANEQPNN